MQNKTGTNHKTKLRSVQGLVNKTAGWHHLMTRSKRTTDRSSPGVGLPPAHGQDLEEGVSPSREGCSTQWDRLECLFLLSPPIVALCMLLLSSNCDFNSA